MARGVVVASGLQWRPLGNGGNPLTGEGKKDERLFDGFRSVGEPQRRVRSGHRMGCRCDLQREHSRDQYCRTFWRIDCSLALNGMGGPDCADRAAPRARADVCFSIRSRMPLLAIPRLAS